MESGLSLFVLAPLVAEYLLGDFPLTWLPLLVVLAPLVVLTMVTRGFFFFPWPLLWIFFFFFGRRGRPGWRPPRW